MLIYQLLYKTEQSDGVDSRSNQINNRKSDFNDQDLRLFYCEA